MGASLPYDASLPVLPATLLCVVLVFIHAILTKILCYSVVLSDILIVWLRKWRLGKVN